MADGGTLFLDEVGELSRAAQVKLLRVLQDQRLERVGSTTPIDVDVRLIAATNVDLRLAVEESRFRSDLFYRLNVLHLELPPLRERQEDIFPLWRHFLRLYSQEEGRPQLDCAPEVVRLLLRYDWPGNIRELGNVARHAVTMRDKKITPRGLPSYLREQTEAADHTKDPVQIPGMSLAELEQIAILRTVESTESIKDAATILGVSERTLYYRLRDYRGE